MTAYYNENDHKAAAWLRELIREGHIAAGDVDERSIEDVLPNDLRGFKQCHFFAGIGGWSYALRLAGWPDERPVWTGSCPCQPFSAAGKGAGFADERHLWPAWHHLIRERRPGLVFGEQVANALGWFDLVSADLANEGYASGAAIVGAHSVGAPHIRQRLYFVAESQGQQQHRCGDSRRGRGELADSGGLGDSESSDWGLPIRGRGPQQGGFESVGTGETGNLGDPDDEGSQGRSERRDSTDKRVVWPASMANTGECEWTGKKNSNTYSSTRQSSEFPRGFSDTSIGSWSAEWVSCRDGKARPVEPGTFPLAHGVPHRVGLLRGYGNAIVPQVAAAFIEAYSECKVDV